MSKCEQCNGSGKITIHHPIAMSDIRIGGPKQPRPKPQTAVCGECRGTGEEGTPDGR